MSAPMVHALLDERKTQTRRTITSVLGRGFGKVTEFHPTKTPGYDWIMRNPSHLWNDLRHDDLLARCPFGGVGDRLWVRETWAPCTVDGPVDDVEDADAVMFDADKAALLFTGKEGETSFFRRLDSYAWTPHRWRPSIHMPRWASRLTLEVTEVRVQRLQDISEADAVAEGFEHVDAFLAFFSTDVIAANPWMWAVSFKKRIP
jgi:hypothetical protein